jgi:hypothetical protein
MIRVIKIDPTTKTISEKMIGNNYQSFLSEINSDEINDIDKIEFNTDNDMFVGNNCEIINQEPNSFTYETPTRKFTIKGNAIIVGFDIETENPTSIQSIKAADIEDEITFN